MEEISLREKTYKKEHAFLSPFATFSEKTKGRQRTEEPCAMRTEFQRDRDRLIYCKSFRRLKNFFLRRAIIILRGLLTLWTWRRYRAVLRVLFL